MKPPDRKCEHCGQGFIEPPNLPIRRKRFCSMRCQQAAAYERTRGKRRKEARERYEKDATYRKAQIERAHERWEREKTPR